MTAVDVQLLTVVVLYALGTMAAWGLIKGVRTTKTQHYHTTNRNVTVKADGYNANVAVSRKALDELDDFAVGNGNAERWVSAGNTGPR